MHEKLELNQDKTIECTTHRCLRPNKMRLNIYLWFLRFYIVVFLAYLAFSAFVGYMVIYKKMPVALNKSQIVFVILSLSMGSVLFPLAIRYIREFKHAAKTALALNIQEPSAIIYLKDKPLHVLSRQNTQILSKKGTLQIIWQGNNAKNHSFYIKRLIWGEEQYESICRFFEKFQFAGVNDSRTD